MIDISIYCCWAAICLGTISIILLVTGFMFTVSVLHHHSNLRNPAVSYRRYWCLLKCFISDFRDDGHDWLVVRIDLIDLESLTAVEKRIGIGKHVICKRCSEEWDLTTLPPLSPLEELALESE